MKVVDFGSRTFTGMSKNLRAVFLELVFPPLIEGWWIRRTISIPNLAQTIFLRSFISFFFASVYFVQHFLTLIRHAMLSIYSRNLILAWRTGMPYLYAPVLQVLRSTYLVDAIHFAWLRMAHIAILTRLVTQSARNLAVNHGEKHYMFHIENRIPHWYLCCLKFTYHRLKFSSFLFYKSYRFLTNV